MANGRIMTVCVYNAERLDPAICAHVKDVFLGFPCLGHLRHLGEIKKRNPCS